MNVSSHDCKAELPDMGGTIAPLGPGTSAQSRPGAPSGARYAPARSGMIPAGFRPARLHEQRFDVRFDYPVIFCRGALQPADPTLIWAVAHREPERRHPVCVVLDGGLVAASPRLPDDVRAYFRGPGSGAIELRGEPIVIAGGEAAKNDPSVLSGLCASFRDRGLDRHAAVLIIGGGAVLDAAGYAASIVHRGIRVVRMPSTVLAQCDGGVGVKNGVNAFASKNFLGTFAPPFAVINDADLLETLPLREVRAGMAEGVKVALIRDAALFEWYEANREALARGSRTELETSIQRAARIHLAHIAEGGDPFELGSNRPLDYGHWAAHKLEILSGHALRHGEAVAIG
ncbi:MAG TPA: 3-dehydroquinate synthase, partial [Polyangiaceae bacterium]